jgi:phytoene dehydrogenase-like protein
LLDGQYKDKTIRKLFNELIDKSQQIYNGWTAVFLGVDMDLKDNADAYHSASYLLTDEEAKQLPGGISKNISVMIRNKQYPGMCPKGKSVILVSFFSKTNFWEKLDEGAPEQNGKGRVYTSRKRSDRYKDAKEKVVKFIVNYLDNHFPGVKEKVECVDVATPLTLIRYTGNYKGSILAWEPFNEAGELMEEYVKKNGPTLPGLSNFYLSGHWMSTGGVIRTVSAARHSLHFICRDDKKKFWANIPKEAPLACAKRWTRKYKPKEILKRIPVQSK